MYLVGNDFSRVSQHPPPKEDDFIFLDVCGVVSHIFLRQMYHAYPVAFNENNKNLIYRSC
jgi:hypothetical protein